MAHLTDLEIAQSCEMRPIAEIARRAGIDEKYLEPYGRYKAKVDPSLLKDTDRPDGRLVLGAGSLYGAINTLTDKGWIEPYGTDNGRTKEYVITEEGRAIAAKELERLKALADIASSIIGGAT